MSVAYIPVGKANLMTVDLEDVPLFVDKYWHLNNCGYPMAWVEGVKVSAHTLLGSGLDHANRDKLDNRKENLRTATKRQNMYNRGSSNNTSGFRGVVKVKNRWQAQISIERKNRYLGLFEHRADAAQAYNYAAYKEAGEFAVLNESEESITWL